MSLGEMDATDEPSGTLIVPGCPWVPVPGCGGKEALYEVRK